MSRQKLLTVVSRKSKVPVYCSKDIIDTEIEECNQQLIKLNSDMINLPKERESLDSEILNELTCSYSLERQKYKGNISQFIERGQSVYHSMIDTKSEITKFSELEVYQNSLSGKFGQLLNITNLYRKQSVERVFNEVLPLYSDNVIIKAIIAQYSILLIRPFYMHNDTMARMLSNNILCYRAGYNKTVLLSNTLINNKDSYIESMEHGRMYGIRLMEIEIDKFAQVICLGIKQKLGL